jgi:inner membrane protein
MSLSAHSMGVKLLIVSALAVSMTVPSLFVASLLEDRTSRAAEVARQITAATGGPQMFLGPTLAIPYTGVHPGVYLIFPAVGAAEIKTVTEERRRSLFKVPVFQADIRMDSQFDLTAAGDEAAAGGELDWSRAEFVIGASDTRGAQADAALDANGRTTILVPSEVAPSLVIGGEEKDLVKISLLGAKAGDIAKPSAKFSVSSILRFSGAQRIAVLSYGKTTHLSARGDWPSPGFDGGFLPVRRSIARNGFSAEWSVPFMARGVRAEAPGNALNTLAATALGTSFIEVADPYQSVSRSLKYVLLFLGLVFLSYFIFEVTAGKRIHPAQYILVGIAQIIFYLLLLSLAERIGFDAGFLLAGISTVALLAANAGWIFDSRSHLLRAFGVFSTLYAIIYLLLRVEDYALLIGAIVSFLVVAAAMYLTRRIDWYNPIAEDTP